jgi:hypothetical protein
LGIVTILQKKFEKIILFCKILFKKNLPKKAQKTYQNLPQLMTT